MAGTEALERDRFSRVVKGNEEPEGKTGLPGGRAKAKLMRRSLEARLQGEDFKPEWEWEKLLEEGHAAWEEQELFLWSGQGLRESLLGKGDLMEELE